jgi:hypothetical protein
MILIHIYSSIMLMLWLRDYTFLKFYAIQLLGKTKLKISTCASMPKSALINPLWHSSSFRYIFLIDFLHWNYCKKENFSGLSFCFQFGCRRPKILQIELLIISKQVNSIKTLIFNTTKTERIVRRSFSAVR